MERYLLPRIVRATAPEFFFRVDLNSSFRLDHHDLCIGLSFSLLLNAPILSSYNRVLHVERRRNTAMAQNAYSSLSVQNNLASVEESSSGTQSDDDSSSQHSSALDWVHPSDTVDAVEHQTFLGGPQDPQQLASLAGWDFRPKTLQEIEAYANAIYPETSFNPDVPGQRKVSSWISGQHQYTSSSSGSEAADSTSVNPKKPESSFIVCGFKGCGSTFTSKNALTVHEKNAISCPGFERNVTALYGCTNCLYLALPADLPGRHDCSKFKQRSLRMRTYLDIATQKRLKVKPLSGFLSPIQPPDFDAIGGLGRWNSSYNALLDDESSERSWGRSSNTSDETDSTVMEELVVNPVSDGTTAPTECNGVNAEMNSLEDPPSVPCRVKTPVLECNWSRPSDWNVSFGQEYLNHLGYPGLRSNASFNASHFELSRPPSPVLHHADTLPPPPTFVSSWPWRGAEITATASHGLLVANGQARTENGQKRDDRRDSLFDD